MQTTIDTRRTIEERMAAAGEDAMPQATLDCLDYWTVREDEPEDFAAQYPAAPVVKATPS